MIDEAEQLIGTKKRRPTFIEVSKQNWDFVREKITLGFSSGMRSRQWEIGMQHLYQVPGSDIFMCIFGRLCNGKDQLLFRDFNACIARPFI